MAEPLRYPIPAARVRSEDVIDRSRFVCTIAPAATPDEAQQVIREIAAAGPDATHHCWAYVAGPPGSTARIGLSDDGEPHGTAGRPMLTVLQHCGIGDIVAVVTRYYGGVKLGTGGLARAYAGSVQSALALLTTREKVEYTSFVVALSYTHYSAAQHLLPSYEATVLSDQFADDVTLTVQVPRTHLSALRAALGNATHGQARFADTPTAPS